MGKDAGSGPSRSRQMSKREGQNACVLYRLKASLLPCGVNRKKEKKVAPSSSSSSPATAAAATSFGLIVWGDSRSADSLHGRSSGSSFSRLHIESLDCAVDDRRNFDLSLSRLPSSLCPASFDTTTGSRLSRRSMARGEWNGDDGWPMHHHLLFTCVSDAGSSFKS